MFCTSGQQEYTTQDAKKRLSSKAAASEETRRYKPHFVWAARPYHRSW